MLTGSTVDPSSIVKEGEVDGGGGEVRRGSREIASALKFQWAGRFGSKTE